MHDGDSMSMREFVAKTMDHYRLFTDQVIQDMFSTMDRDGDSRISAEDAQRVFKEKNVPCMDLQPLFMEFARGRASVNGIAIEKLGTTLKCVQPSCICLAAAHFIIQENAKPAVTACTAGQFYKTFASCFCASFGTRVNNSRTVQWQQCNYESTRPCTWY